MLGDASRMPSHDEIDILKAFDGELREIQTELVEWEHVSPRCSVLKLRRWEADMVQRGDGSKGAGVEG